MNSIIEVYAPRLEHVLYVEQYSHDYKLNGSPFSFTVNKENAMKFEHEEALRISNILFDYFRSNLRTFGFPKDTDPRKEFSVYVNKKEKKEYFPTWLVIFLIVVLFIGFCHS